MDYEIFTPVTPDELAGYYALRWEVLLKPWDQPLDRCKDDMEGCTDHLAARNGEGEIIAVARLQLNTPTEAQIRFMAVAETARGIGLGRAMVLRMEQIAREQGAEIMVLNARETAIDFYHKLDYHITGPAATVFKTVHHAKMQKDIG